LGIVDANRLSVEDAVAAMPSVRSTLLGWFRPIALTRVIQRIVDFKTLEIEEPLSTRGVVQPLTETSLMLKPEGQRAWKWFLIHATPDLVLAVNDVIILKGDRLRIQKTKDYSVNGYVCYEACEDFNYVPES
jgi:hypothetical protein